MTKSELQRIKDRVDSILNSVLCDMKPGWDDSIEGFNIAWNLVSATLKEEIGRCQP